MNRYRDLYMERRIAWRSGRHLGLAMARPPSLAAGAPATESNPLDEIVRYRDLAKSLDVLARGEARVRSEPSHRRIS